jgi:aspartate kinase
VIHPKTIHPLVQSQIPLYVKPFMHPEEPGTLISAQEGEVHPVFIYKFNQFLVSFETRDSSFIHESHLGQIMDVLAEAPIHVNLMQISATSVSLLFDYREGPWMAVRQQLSPHYSIRYNEGLHLLTVKNYPPVSDEELVKGGEVLISQRTRATLQILYRPAL